MKRFAVVIVAAACGHHAAPAAPANVSKASFEDQVAVLPPAITELWRQPRTWVTETSTSISLALGLGFERSACFDKLTPRIDALYWGMIEGEAAPINLFHGDVTPDDIARCFIESVKRRPHPDSRILAFEGLGGDSAVAMIAPGWLAQSEHVEAIVALLASKQTGRHPFAKLAPLTGEQWTLEPADFTSELLGVTSLGVAYDAPISGPGPVRGTMFFGDDEAARTAYERFVHPETYKPLAVSVSLDAVKASRDLALAHGTLHVVGATVTFEGSRPELPEYVEPTRIFRALAKRPR